VEVEVVGAVVLHPVAVVGVGAVEGVVLHPVAVVEEAV